jgi:hypothetical protein
VSRLHQHRIKISLWIAAIEGVLTLLGAWSHWLVYGLAVVAIALFVGIGRNASHHLAYELSWIFAVSQCAAVLVPVVWFIAKWAAITAIVVIAVAALVYLFMERDHRHAGHDHPHAGTPE